MAVLLHHRGQLDRELNGTTLGVLASAIGEELFDEVMDAGMPTCLAPASAVLPRLDQLPVIGSALQSRRDTDGPTEALFEAAARLIRAAA